MAHPDWKLDAIAHGLAKLTTLSLERTPAMDVIRATAVTWHEAITHDRAFDQARDRPRFDAAFRTLASECRSWPTPRDFLDALPAVKPPAEVVRIDDESLRQRGMQHIGDIAQRMGWNSHGDDSDVSSNA